MTHTMLSYALQIARLSVWLVLLLVIFAPLERLFALHPQRILRKAVFTDVLYYFLNNVLTGALMSVPLATVAWLAHRYVPTSVTATIAAWPLAVRIVAALVIGEVGFYWGHRWSHELPILWRFHALHHSAEEMDFLVSARAHPVDMVFTRLCGMIPLYILGLATPMGHSGTLIAALLVATSMVWGFFIHANVKWRFGVAESVVSTPAFHHWHHTNDGAAYINKNYAPLMPFIDRLFGTFYLPAHAPARYGIDQPIATSVVGQLIEPFEGLLKTQPTVAAPAAQSQPEHTTSDRDSLQQSLSGVL